MTINREQKDRKKHKRNTSEDQWRKKIGKNE